LSYLLRDALHTNAMYAVAKAKSLGKLFLHGFCLGAQMSMRTRTAFPLTE